MKPLCEDVRGSFLGRFLTPHSKTCIKLTSHHTSLYSLYSTENRGKSREQRQDECMLNMLITVLFKYFTPIVLQNEKKMFNVSQTFSSQMHLFNQLLLEGCVSLLTCSTKSIVKTKKLLSFHLTSKINNIIAYIDRFI